ncbi:hypothetical protein GCM10028807_51740 [Spirosoma daeguense]
MRRIHIDLNFEYFLDHFQGHAIKIKQHRKTGEILFDADSVAPILGFASAEELLAHDTVLASLNQQITQGQACPIRRLHHEIS